MPFFFFQDLHLLGTGYASDLNPDREYERFVQGVDRALQHSSSQNTDADATTQGINETFP